MRPRRLAFASVLLGLLLPSTGRSQALAALCQKDHKVRFFDGRSGEVLAEEDAGPAARVLATAPDQLKLYVANDPSPRNPDATLRAIGMVSGHLEGQSVLPGCRGVSAVEAGPGGSLLIACQESEDLLEVSATDGWLQRRHPVGRGAVGLVYQPETGLLFIANRLTGEVLSYNLEERRILRRMPAARTPIDMELGYGGTMIGLLDAAGPSVLFFEPEAETFGKPVRVGAGPHRMRFVGPGSQVLVTVAKGPSVQVVDLEEESLHKALDLGVGATGIAVDPAGQNGWISNPQLGTVSLLDLESWSLVHTFPIAGGPDELIYLRQ